MINEAIPNTDSADVSSKILLITKAQQEKQVLLGMKIDVSMYPQHHIHVSINLVYL